jgi:hypothetical protein
MNLLDLVPVVHSAAIIQTQDCEPSYKPSIVLILCIYYEMACCIFGEDRVQLGSGSSWCWGW